MQPQKTAKPIVGGALLLVAGLIGMANWAMVIIGSSQFDFFPGLSGILVVCGAIGLIFSLIALLGGVFALMRKMWGLALVGSIFGLLTIGFLFTSSLFSLIALIMIAISRSEFQ